MRGVASPLAGGVRATDTRMMAAMLLRVQVWVRGRLRRLVVTAVLIGVFGGLVIGLAAGTRRTDTAPARYTAQAGGDPDLLITQLSGQPLTAEVADLTGVAEASSIAFVTSFLVAPTDGSPVLDPNPYAGDDRLTGARVVEGRFADPAAPNEFTVNRSLAKLLAERFGTRVGDRFQVTSFDQQQVAANAFDTGERPRVPLFTATLVGITETPADFDDPSASMVFSRSFLRVHPTVGVVQTIIAARLEAGTDPATVMDAVHRLPNGADAYPIQSRIVSVDARRAVRFQVTSLWLVTAIAAIAVAVVVAQLTGRMLRMTDDERSSLAAVGWRPRDLAIERVIEGAVGVAIAAPIAAMVGFWPTALFPLGVLRLFEPRSGPRMDWTVTIGGLIALAAIMATTAALVGRRRMPVDDRDDHVRTLVSFVAASGVGMPLATGARLSTSGPGGGRRLLGSLVAGAVGVAGLVASAVVGLTLTSIVGHPARWGVNYDQLFGNPYIPTNDDIVTPTVTDRDVAALTAANIGSLTINGRDTAMFAVDAVKGGLEPTTLEGRPPAAEDEIGLGAEVARRLGLRVGDVAKAVGSTGTARQLQVVGIVVTPDSAGDGSTMTFDGYAALSPTATKNILLVDFRHGAPADAAKRLEASNFSPPGALTTPTSVRALERVTAAPFLLGVVLTVLLVVSCAYLLAASVRARQRDLATLRALGSESRQLRAIIHWQATLGTTLVLLIGLPCGVILGRWIIELVTNALGIVPGAEVPALVVVAMAVTVLATANLLALMPAHHAAHIRTGDLLRD